MRNVWDRESYRWYKYKKDWKASVKQFCLDLRCCRQRIPKHRLPNINTAIRNSRNASISPKSIFHLTSLQICS